MENTAILNNTAKMSGGGITNDNGTLTISGSLISNNSVTGTGGSFGKGGGIAMKVGGISTIANSTISGNNASQEGGGVYISDGTININNSTIAFNTSDNDNDSSGDGGGIYNNGSNTVNLFHTIISDNTNGLGVSASPSDLYGTIITQGYNLIKDALTAGTLVDGVGGDQVGVDPLLTALSDNGGLTQTHEIPFNSPAINAGDPAYSGELTIDQRGTGFIREAQTTIDIGAYENQTGNAIIVTTVTDETFDGGDLSAETADGTGLSLREAIAVANAGENVGFDSEISGGTITLTNGEIALNKALIIDGDINEDDKADITISGGGASRAMNITADATLISITIDNSNAGTGNGGAGNSGGGSNFGFGSSMPPNVNTGPPPSPVETKLPERSQRMPNVNNRPDIMSARGIQIDSNLGNPFEEERITRPEMKGPTSSGPPQNQNIASLLSGLKTKQLDVNEKKNNEASTISIEDLKELTNARIPTKSKRKQKSDKNIVSLDI